MSKVTSKLQVSIPKAVATRYAIKPGDEVTFLAAGDSIRLVPPAADREEYDASERLEIFDRATRRQAQRQRQRQRRTPAARGKRQAGRGWTRAELYERGRAR
jgi:AbrB family looped-hinge helix DNA binding protein